MLPPSSTSFADQVFGRVGRSASSRRSYRFPETGQRIPGLVTGSIRLQSLALGLLLSPIPQNIRKSDKRWSVAPEHDRQLGQRRQARTGEESSECTASCCRNSLLHQQNLPGPTKLAYLLTISKSGGEGCFLGSKNGYQISILWSRFFGTKGRSRRLRTAPLLGSRTVAGHGIRAWKGSDWHKTFKWAAKHSKG